jgi:hypothetical protein
MKDIGAFHIELQQKYRDGTIIAQDYVDFMAEKKIENEYAQRFGIKASITTGTDGSPKTTDKTNELISFFIGRDVVFFDDHARKAKETIDKFGELLAQQNPEGLSGTERMTIARIKNGRTRLDKQDGIDRLVLWGQHYNDWLEIIFRAGVGFTAYNIDDVRS